MNLLYICDAARKWAIANDEPKVRAWLNDLDELFEDEILPITITEIEQGEQS